MNKIILILLLCQAWVSPASAAAVLSQGKLDKAIFTMYTTVRRVPETRTVNGQPLSSNVIITTVSGNAATATTLATPRTINGVAFDGSANIQTATGNTSDYASTAWTPTRSTFTEVPGGGSITSSGSYTKVGNLVTLYAKIVCSGGATISATTSSRFTNVPIAPKTGQAYLGSWYNGTTGAYGRTVLSATALYMVTGWSAASNTYHMNINYEAQ